jgi:hypothetical protein
MSIDFRRAAAREIQHQRSVLDRLRDRQAFLRLERERLIQLGLDLPCRAIAEAVDYIDSAVVVLGEAARHVT